MKQARALRLCLEADVEPDRGVEGRVLVDQDRLELGLERVGLLVRREVAPVATPAADRVDDTADHLLDRALALRRGHAAAEVLLRDDVRRGLRPELGELDVLLLERRAVAAGDVRVAQLPLDRIERIDARNREVACRSDARLRIDDRVHDLFGRRLRDLRLLRGCHRFLPDRVRHYTSSRPGERRSSCERAGDGRSRAGRYVATKKSLQIGLNGPDGHSTRYRLAAVGERGLRRACRRRRGRRRARPGGVARRIRGRLRQGARATARRARAAAPGRTKARTCRSSGATCARLIRACVPVVRSVVPVLAVPVSTFPSPPPWLLQSSAEPSAVGSQPPGSSSLRSALCSARVMTSSASTYGPMSSGMASIASS